MAIHALCFSADKAHADEYFSFVEVHCVPNMGLFSIKTFSEYNLPGVEKSTPAALERIEKSDGIFLLSKFIENIRSANNTALSTCHFDSDKQHHTLTAYVADYHSPEDGGFCSGVESATIIIKMDDVVVSRIEAGGGCDEKTESRDSIFVNFGMSTIEKCSEYKGFSIEPSQEPQPIKEFCQVKKF